MKSPLLIKNSETQKKNFFQLTVNIRSEISLFSQICALDIDFSSFYNCGCMDMMFIM